MFGVAFLHLTNSGICSFQYSLLPIHAHWFVTIQGLDVNALRLPSQLVADYLMDVSLSRYCIIIADAYKSGLSGLSGSEGRR
jgi:hypothetical protein